MGIFSDEGGRFIGGHALREAEQLKTASGLSKLWDGAPVTRPVAARATSCSTGAGWQCT